MKLEMIHGERSFWRMDGVQWFDYSPTIAKILTPNGAILLGWFLDQLLVWDSSEQEMPGEVEATIEQICEGTGLGRKMVLNARVKLREVLRWREKRLEHKMFYSIDMDKLEQIIGGSR